VRSRHEVCTNRDHPPPDARTIQAPSQLGSPKQAAWHQRSFRIRVYPGATPLTYRAKAPPPGERRRNEQEIDDVKDSGSAPATNPDT